MAMSNNWHVKCWKFNSLPWWPLAGWLHHTVVGGSLGTTFFLCGLHTDLCPRSTPGRSSGDTRQWHVGQDLGCRAWSAEQLCWRDRSLRLLLCVPLFATVLTPGPLPALGGPVCPEADTWGLHYPHSFDLLFFCWTQPKKRLLARNVKAEEDWWMGV